MQRTRVTRTVPFLAVAQMHAALAHYIGRLGFEEVHRWIDDGELRWCWLEHGGAALMLQEFRTEGKNARVFEGRRGEGVEFAFTPSERATTAVTVSGASGWPFGDLAPVTDADGYTVLAEPGALQLEPTTGRRLSTVIPVIAVTNLAQSVRYYCEGLGFAEHDHTDADGEMRGCPLRRDDVVLVLRQEDASSAHRGQGVTIYHLCHDAVVFHNEVTARGVAASEPHVGNRMWVVELKDPDGYRLAFESPTSVPEETKLSELADRDNET